MSLNKKHNVYFIGIGGIGMSALAFYFFEQGKRVAGYDKTPTQITEHLERKGIAVCFDASEDVIPNRYLNSNDTLIVYTPAIPDKHEQLNYFKRHNFEILKRAEVLGKITENTFCFAVAGTHGKTTTSTILGHIMQPFKATAFLGGISENYNSNLILGDDKISVVEADEFDRSFLHLSPNIACVTSTDADHLDIYGNHDELLHSFKEFSEKVTDNLVVAKGVPLKGITYAVEEDADFKAVNVRVDKGQYCFDVQTPNTLINDVVFVLPGRHNIMNAMAALTMAHVYGVSLEVIKKRLASFKGIERRFSYKIKRDDLVLIDDYAHHPTEINAVINSVREMYPSKSVLGIFQPHLFSRTRDFADDFALALSQFDELILLDIYPARELPISGITSAWLLDKVKMVNKKVSSKENLIENIRRSEAQIIVMLGAGDIGLLISSVKEFLEKKGDLLV